MVLGALKEHPGTVGRGVCAWPALGGAIVSEVSATLALRQALNQPGFYVMVGIGYALAFIFLSLTLKAGMPLGVAYGIWGALGVVLTAVLSMLVFGEPITVLVALGIALIMAGVLLVEVGAQRAGTQDKDGGAS
ncbi:DMT family transporter [Actinomyces oris]|uniref:DMT family transporter n=1 Tax=Actinomyces oris TaxID=544580 RepID=UPI003D2EF620